MLRFYSHPASTCARRVHIVQLEKHIEFEPVALDIPARAHRAPESLALNPYGRVPTIDDDRFVLYKPLGDSSVTHSRVDTIIRDGERAQLPSRAS
jgi:glutathione S-transferase